MKNTLLKLLSWVFIAVLVASTCLVLTSYKAPEPAPQKARIISYTAGGTPLKSWVSSNKPEISCGVVCFENREGKQVCVSGNFTVEEL